MKSDTFSILRGPRLTATNFLYTSILAISSIDVLGTLGQEGAGVDTILEWFSPEYYEANWQFDPDTLVLDEKSMFLVFSSDHGPIVGDFRVNAPSDDLPVSGELPEPTTFLVMGVGAIFLRLKRR